MRRIFLAFVAASLLAPPAQAATPRAKPQRVMSLNLCTDQLALSLLPRERIVSVSFLSSSREQAYLTAEAHGVPVNFGSAEEVLAARPDLVLMGGSATPTMRDLLARVSVPVLDIPFADDFRAIRRNTRAVGKALGEEEKAEALIARMNATLAELSTAASSRQVSIAAWDGSGDVPGRGTLFDAILRAAGVENIAAGINARFGSFDMEQLIVAHPSVIGYGNTLERAPGLRRDTLRHPLLRKLYAKRFIEFPETLYNCGLPQSAEAAKALRAAIAKALTDSP